MNIGSLLSSLVLAPGVVIWLTEKLPPTGEAGMAPQPKSPPSLSDSSTPEQASAIIGSAAEAGIAIGNQHKRASKHPDPQIRRAIKAMRADPCFRQLNKEWTDLIPLERATLIDRILAAAPGNRNQRALTGLLSRHIKYESTIRHYRRMLKNERSRHSGKIQVPIEPLVAHEDEPAPGSRESESPEESRSLPEADAQTVVTASPSLAATETTLTRADLSTVFEVGSPPKTNAELNKLANDLVNKVRDLSPNSGFALANLSSLRKRLQSRSDPVNGFSEIPTDSEIRRSDDSVKPGKTEDPVLRLTDLLLTECESVENGLNVVARAETFFNENPFWHRPRSLEEGRACVQEWKQELRKMDTIDIENRLPKDHPMRKDQKKT